jgi:hypothetical protein
MQVEIELCGLGRVIGPESFFDVTDADRRLVDALLECVDAVDKLEWGVAKGKCGDSGRVQEDNLAENDLFESGVCEGSEEEERTPETTGEWDGGEGERREAGPIHESATTREELICRRGDNLSE